MDLCRTNLPEIVLIGSYLPKNSISQHWIGTTKPTDLTERELQQHFQPSVPLSYQHRSHRLALHPFLAGDGNSGYWHSYA